MRTTETPKGQRMAKILTFLIRNRPRKYAAKDIQSYLNLDEEVSLRNVQRDLKELYNIPNCHVQQITEKGKVYYQIEEDMRSKLTLPIERNAIMALFLLKKLQPFFAPRAKTFKEMGEAISELSTPKDYDLFEDFDEKLEESTQILGEQSALTIADNMLNDLMVSLMERRRLKIRYQKSFDEKPTSTSICPVKLVMYKGELYFMCIAETVEDRNYWMKLCRIVHTELTDNKFHVSPERMEKIEKRLKKSSGILSDAAAKPKKIELRFPYYFDRIFSEKRFHSTQKMKKNKNGDVILTMEVPIDTDLIQWILGWSTSVMVAKPKDLKDKMKDMGKFLMKSYGK